jgi:hypothetical protein
VYGGCVARKKQGTEKKHILPLPEKDSPDYFRTAVRNCITAYEELNNDTMALNFCKITDKRLRALVLDDAEYKAETRSIYARQRLAEIEEIEYLAELASAADMDDDADTDTGEFVHPSERGIKRRRSKAVIADKDMLNIRFKAAQLKREMLKDMANVAGDTERDAVNFIFVPITRDDFERLLTVEISEGSNDADIDALIGVREDVPVGTKGLDTADAEDGTFDDDMVEVLPGGEIREKS